MYVCISIFFFEPFFEGMDGGWDLHSANARSIKQRELWFIWEAAIYWLVGTGWKNKTQGRWKKNPEPDRNQTDRNRTGPGPDRTRTGPGPEWHPRSKGFPSWIMDHGSWINDQVSRIMDHGSRINDQVSRIMDQVSSIKDQGSWTLFWHEWPSWKGYGRDIKTVQIYNRRPIILYRFRNIQDLGPCFGMNGHPRRATDMILSLSKSTTEDLSFYIGFVKD